MVCITGGAGFIGSHLAEKLLAAGDRVLVLDNFATGRRDNLPAHRELDLREGTVADPVLVDGIFDEFRPEVVVHAAASYKDPANWEEDARTNVIGMVNVVKASERFGIQRLIYFQTSLCYGLHPAEHPITLRCPLDPGGSSYAVSKTAAEHYLRLSRLDYRSFRLANAYGPRNLSGPLPTFYQRLQEKKPCFVMDTRRDFIYVEDLLEVVVQGLQGRGRRGCYHIATGSDYAIRELFEAAVKTMGIRLETPVEVRPRQDDDAYTILLDPAETCRDFAWRARTPLEEGVREAVKWYQALPLTQTFTHLKNMK